MSLKAAILGTQHPDVTETEQKILRAAGAEGFRCMAGYVPAKMPIDKSTLSPVDESYVTKANKFMNALCGQTIKDCNPRIPYLVAVWLLLGIDNPHRLRLYTDDIILWQVAGLLMRLVIANAPYDSYQNLPILKWEKPDTTDWLKAQLYDVAHPLVGAIHDIHDATHVTQTVWFLVSIKPKTVMSDDVKSEVMTRARRWKNLSDEDLLQLIRPLVLEILSSEENET